MTITRIKRLIMECVPYTPGTQTTFADLYSSVSSYSSELGFTLVKQRFSTALELLHQDQCLVFFGEDDIRPTQYGLNNYSD